MQHKPGGLNVVPDALSRDNASITVGSQTNSLKIAVESYLDKYSDKQTQSSLDGGFIYINRHLGFFKTLET